MNWQVRKIPDLSMGLERNHMPHPPLVLASSSVYRRALLDRLGWPYLVAAPQIDETPQSGESPSRLALRLAVAKAKALAGRFPGHLIIGSDQVAELDGKPVGKPGALAPALAQLETAAGRSVVFHTAVCVLDADSDRVETCVVPTEVRFRRLSREAIARYLAREPAFDCAGSFKAEGLGIALCERIVGDDPTALIGLPLIALCRLLGAFGCDVLALDSPDR